MYSRAWVLFPALLILVLAQPHVVAASPTEDTAQLVKDLIGEDYRRAKRAENELAIAGVKSLTAVLEARSKIADAPRRARCDRVISPLVEDLIKDLTRQSSVEGYAAPLALGGGAGVVVSPEIAVGKAPREEDKGELTPAEVRRRAMAARETFKQIGAPATWLLLRIPPLRTPESQRVLWFLARKIADETVAEVAKALADQKPDPLARLLPNFDLLGFVVQVGMQDERKEVRLAYQRFRDAGMKIELDRLTSPDFQIRRAAEDALFRLGGMSFTFLDQRAKIAKKAGKKNEERLAADLALRIKFGLSRELYIKIGRTLENYDAMSFRERREVCLELERLGGVDGVPALRSILQREASRDVRVLAALCLARLGDPVGIIRLQREGISQSVSVPKADLIAIYMDQGIRYLNIRRFHKAEKEFLRVLKLEPLNDTALYNLACTYSLWGKLDKAVEALVKAASAGFDDVSHMNTDPDLDPLRGDARFRALISSLEKKKGGAASPPGTGPRSED